MVGRPVNDRQRLRAPHSSFFQQPQQASRSPSRSSTSSSSNHAPTTSGTEDQEYASHTTGVNPTGQQPQRAPLSESWPALPTSSSSGPRATSHTADRPRLSYGTIAATATATVTATDASVETAPTPRNASSRVRDFSHQLADRQQMYAPSEDFPQEDEEQEQTRMRSHEELRDRNERARLLRRRSGYDHLRVREHGQAPPRTTSPVQTSVTINAPVQPLTTARTSSRPETSLASTAPIQQSAAHRILNNPDVLHAVLRELIPGDYTQRGARTLLRFQRVNTAFRDTIARRVFQRALFFRQMPLADTRLGNLLLASSRGVGKGCYFTPTTIGVNPIRFDPDSPEPLLYLTYGTWLAQDDSITFTVHYPRVLAALTRGSWRDMFVHPIGHIVRHIRIHLVTHGGSEFDATVPVGDSGLVGLTVGELLDLALLALRPQTDVLIKSRRLR